MKFLVKVTRSQRLVPSRRMLIAYIDNPRSRGRPIISRKASMIESPHRFGKYNGFTLTTWPPSNSNSGRVEARNDPFLGHTSRGSRV